MKHWAGLPTLSAKACLGDLRPDRIAISRDPRAHIGQKAIRALRNLASLGSSMSRAANSISISRVTQELAKAGVNVGDAPLVLVEHHLAHMASAFFCSPFDEAAILSIDGFGDFCSVMWGIGRGNKMEVKGEVNFPHSLGIFYTAFTQHLGFPKYGDEYKMMGLSAYGEPRFAQKVRDAVRLDGDQIRLNLDYFTHHTNGVEMTWENGSPEVGPIFSQKLVDVFGPARKPGSSLEQQHSDLAASVQVVLEENYLGLLNHIQKQTGMKAICLAGGVALNCVANGMIFDRTPFQDVYVQPASHDAGTSIGAALYVQHQLLNQPRSFVMRHVYYGPEYTDTEIQTALGEAGAEFHRLDEQTLLQNTAKLIADGNVVGWFQGRMEFGPRALGSRSILADPRDKDMKDTLNKRIKFREHFRPFCPSILANRVGEYFETDYPSPFMVMAYKIKPHQREKIPAVTHQDGTGRLQTVEEDVNPRYYKLIEEFDRITGVPILINTSFNENEPIVNTPAQAIDCFLRTKMDALAIGSFLLLKTENVRSSDNRVAFAEAAAG